MIDELQYLMNAHIKWLRDNTALRQVGRWTEVTTPYLDRHNDRLQIYARVDDGTIHLTDDGFTIRDLESSGCQISSPKRQQLLELTLNGFGVLRQGNALTVEASTDTFAVRKNNLVQAMLAVGDLFYLAEPFVSSLFWEDVRAWLDVHDVRYTERVSFAGRSGYNHVFDFVIPRSSSTPERILRTVNRPDRQTAEVLAFSWIDVREGRPGNARAMAVLNDEQHALSGGLVAALKSYEIDPLLWSKRESFAETLAS